MEAFFKNSIKTTEVFNTYWEYANERQNVF